MKQVIKFKLSKTHIAIICTALLLVVAIIGYAVVSTVAAARGDGDSSSPSAGEPPLSVMAGESTYGAYNVAYERVTTSDISAIEINNNTGKYGFIRTEKSTPMIMYYNNGKEDVNYLPPYYESQGDISSYEDFYSFLSASDGTAQGYLLTYLSVSIGTMYFYDRIELPTVPTLSATATDAEKAEAAAKETERNEMLREFGFSNPQYVTFTYYNGEKKDDGTAAESGHMITIGGQDAGGNGYYYMVDGRNYIYYTGSQYLQYALYGVEKYIKGSLVAPGLSQDGPYEPYLTSDFKQWRTERFETVGDSITADSLVVAVGSTMIPTNPKSGEDTSNAGAAAGYYSSSYGSISFDFHDALVTHSDYRRFMKLVSGKTVGTYYDSSVAGSDPASRLYLSLLTPLGTSSEKALNFSDKSSLTYTYHITAVEAVITDTEEITSEDKRAGAEYSLVRVAYNYYIDGTLASAAGAGSQHAIIDITDSRIPAEAREALASSPIGKRSSDPIIFDITYTKENALVGEIKLTVDSISLITDSKGNTLDKVTADAYVMFTYHQEEDGVSQGYKTWCISMADLKNDTESQWAKLGLYNVLLGEKMDPDFDYEFTVSTRYYELMRDYTCFAIDRIKYFVTYDIVTSFKFVNASERDPYYGETFYINTLENEYKMYGLNADACEKVVNYLGGVGSSGTTVSAGLYGETVAVGLTFDNFEKYGLDAHRIYFELPRGIFPRDEITGDGSSTGDAELSDYDWYSTLGFNLYISDVKYDADGSAYRYIGSDMYDVITKVDAENFAFLDMEFTEFWARRYMILMDINKISSIGVDFNMSDVYGEYDFDIHRQVNYIGVKGSETVYSTSKENLIKQGYTVSDTTLTKEVVRVTAGGEGDKDIAFLEGLMDTEFKRYCLSTSIKNQQNGRNPINTTSLTLLYNRYHGYDDNYYLSNSLDSVGTDNFKTVVSSIFMTTYHGVLTEEEKAGITVGGDYLMRLCLAVEDGAKTAYYGYEFYRVSDRKVMVMLYETDAAGNRIYGTTVGDFYVTTFAFKQIVDNIVGLLNCELIDESTGYPGT